MNPLCTSTHEPEGKRQKEEARELRTEGRIGEERTAKKQMTSTPEKLHRKDKGKMDDNKRQPRAEGKR